MAEVIAITNQKGGVGKTTTSINLGACLAAAEKKTLIIDLDPQGNASVGLGLDRDSFADQNIYHVMIGDSSMKEVIQGTELQYLDVCPSDNNLSGAEIELVSVIARESILKNAIEGVKDEYDYIIIDCAPSLGLLTLNALNSADKYIIPMQTEYFSMEGLAQLLNTIKLVKNSLNPNIDLEGIVLTMFDGRSNLHKQVAAEVRGHFKNLVFETAIPRNIKLSECPSFGKPIILYDIDSNGSKAYLELTQEFLNRKSLGLENVEESFSQLQ